MARLVAAVSRIPPTLHRLKFSSHRARVRRPLESQPFFGLVEKFKRTGFLCTPNWWNTNAIVAKEGFKEDSYCLR